MSENLRLIDEQREAMRAKYSKRHNLLHFCRDILGYKDIDDEVHGPIVDLIQEHDSALILIPRGHLKSTLLTISAAIQEVCIDPNIRIWITNAVMDQARKFMREIKDQMESNVLLRKTWPEIFWSNPSKEAQKWTEDELIVKRSSRSKEATITVGSVGKETTGSHYDLHIYDDLVNLENVSSPEMIEKTYKWYKMSLSLLEPNGRKWIIGTRYDYSDMYGKLLETSMARIVMRCRDYEQSPPKVLFPRKFTNKILDRIRDEQGSWIFSSQYENDPTDQKTAPFKREFLQFWDTLPTPMNLYTLVDLAISDAKKACETAILVVGYSLEGNLYVVEDASGILTPDNTVESLYRIDFQYGGPPMGVERMQLEKAMRYWLNQAAERKGKMLTYYELRPDMDKHRRIVSNLQPMWEQRRIFLKPGMQELESQFLRFPRYSMRDRIDAMAYFNQLVFKPGISVKTVKWVGDYGCVYEKQGNRVVHHGWKYEKPTAKGSMMTF